MFTRRELIKAGLVSLPAFHYAARAGAARSSPANTNGSGSPPTTPFVDPLPIPPVAQPTTLNPAPGLNPVAGEAPRDPHQLWNEFLPQKSYDIHELEADHSFHSELPLNKIWGFDGIFPGPTFHANYGEPVVVRFHNDLPSNHVGIGIPETTTHLHGGHTGSESDGFPNDFYASGLFKDNHYPNFFAGGGTGSGGDPNEAQGTLWYHDHRVDFTTQNVYKGLAGFYLLFDKLDSGNETDPPSALGLPSGEFDIPLVFADKRFTRDGEVFLNPFDLDGFIGDKFTVNGVIQPFLNVARRKYRFRLLNAGPSRFYEFFLSPSRPFIHIANDGNLLPAPLTRTSVRLSVAERADVIIDFSNNNIGDQIFLVNRLAQEDGTGPTGDLLNPGTPILRFDVDRTVPNDPSRVPATLRQLPPIDFSQVVKTRTWEFSDDNGGWTVNGQFFNVNKIRATPKRGTAEIWVLQNGGGGWSHPIHIHLVTFRVLSRNGRPPAPHEVARKDTVELGPDDEVKVFIPFQDFLGRYPAHCHNTVHEDHAMMFRWDAVA